MRSIRFAGLAILPVMAALQPASAAGSDETTAPRVFRLEGARLQTVKQRLRAGDAELAPAFDRLQRDARRALEAGPYSVMQKHLAPPSGDKHDYMSLAPYWWPDPDTPDGLPYIRRDGERNPEINRISDKQALGRMIGAVETLALGYYFTGDNAYAARAAELLRVWFLDPETRMNPNLNYGQAVPGRSEGRGFGLIETVGLTGVVDTVGLLAESEAWTDADHQALVDWFSRFLDWMQTSEIGRAESATKNNHVTWYDVQVASFALFAENRDLAKSVLQQAGEARIARQIEPDGRQPHELARTKSWSYSVMNLRGMMELARLGEHVGVDLWNYKSDDGRSLRGALDFLLAYANDDREWPYQQLGGFSARSLDPLIRQAAVKFPQAEYQSLAASLPRPDRDSRSRLTDP